MISAALSFAKDSEPFYTSLFYMHLSLLLQNFSDELWLLAKKSIYCISFQLFLVFFQEVGSGACSES